jgi:ubiquinone/menaquinone biosynthesis C-methylase UbiE
MTITPSPSRSYPTNDGSLNTAANHWATADLLDVFTRSRIVGLVRLLGATCVDVVAGGGSMGLWLSHMVGQQGRVTVTDFRRPKHLPARENLAFIQHDITSGPLPVAEQDFVNVRLVLGYLSMREHILHRLIGTLNRGGVLLTQDWWMCDREGFVIEAPSEDARAVLEKCYDTYLEVLRKFGYEGVWSRRAHEVMLSEGLTNVRSEIYGATEAFQWAGSSSGTLYMLAEFGKYKPYLIANGMTQHELDRVRTLLLDPRVVIRGHQLYSVSGKKPGANPHAITP